MDNDMMNSEFDSFYQDIAQITTESTLFGFFDDTVAMEGAGEKIRNFIKRAKDLLVKLKEFIKRKWNEFISSVRKLSPNKTKELKEIDVSGIDIKIIDKAKELYKNFISSLNKLQKEIDTIQNIDVDSEDYERDIFIEKYSLICNEISYNRDKFIEQLRSYQKEFKNFPFPLYFNMLEPIKIAKNIDESAFAYIRGCEKLLDPNSDNYDGLEANAKYYTELIELSRVISKHAVDIISECKQVLQAMNALK